MNMACSPPSINSLQLFSQTDLVLVVLVQVVSFVSGLIPTSKLM